ncbi:unnamed protein product [Schistocephalus solidus]|uniref:DUF7083 domain-containing protein n=1 Tax=Schistocephalus solidus TaxID=70667 RepID=A0A183T1N1_SCHSO|nr:unnamed protein product [Schistocephalus solidus]
MNLKTTEFNYDPNGGVNFEVRFCKYALLFEENGSNLENKEKVDVMLLKLGQREHERFSKSLFNRRYECFDLEKQSHEDYFDLAGRLNDACHQADLEQATSQQIKALLFLKLLTLPEEADVRTRLLAQLDQKAEMTVQQLAEECVRSINIKNDTRLIGDVNSQHDVFQATIVFEDKAGLSEIYVSKSKNELIGNKTISQLGRLFQEICCAVNITEEDLKKKYAEHMEMSVGTCTKITLVVGRTDEVRLQRLDKVMENLIDYGLKINMEKSEFLRKEIHYLGFVVSESGRSPDPE